MPQECVFVHIGSTPTDSERRTARPVRVFHSYKEKYSEVIHIYSECGGDVCRIGCAHRSCHQGEGTGTARRGKNRTARSWSMGGWFELVEGDSIAGSEGPACC